MKLFIFFTGLFLHLSAEGNAGICKKKKDMAL